MKNIFLLTFLSIFIISCDKTSKTKQDSSELTLESYKKTDSLNTVDDYQGEELLVFKVQIAALKNVNEKLDNLEDVDVYYEDNFTKYRLGSFSNYQDARNFRLEVLGTYRGAFVQALKNDTPISITEALN